MNDYSQKFLIILIFDVDFQLQYTLINHRRASIGRKYFFKGLRVFSSFVFMLNNGSTSREKADRFIWHGRRRYPAVIVWTGASRWIEIGKKFLNFLFDRRIRGKWFKTTYRFKEFNFSLLLSEEENKRVFGKCNNVFGHGHNYTGNLHYQLHYHHVVILLTGVASKNRALFVKCIFLFSLWKLKTAFNLELFSIIWKFSKNIIWKELREKNWFLLKDWTLLN